MAIFKLIEHKNRHRLCPEDLPSSPSSEAAAELEPPEPALGPWTPLSFVHCLREKPVRAHLAVQTKRASLSIKEPLGSTRLATGCHCYSTHTKTRSISCRGWIWRGPGLPSAGLSQNCHPFGWHAASQPRVPSKSHMA